MFFIKRHYPHVFPLNRRRFEAVGVLSFTKRRGCPWDVLPRHFVEHPWSLFDRTLVFPRPTFSPWIFIFFKPMCLSWCFSFIFIKFYFLQDDVALWMNEWVVVELGSLSVTSTDVSLSIIETLEMRRKSRNFTEITEISGVRSRPWRPSVAIGGRPCSIFHFPIFPI